jgi:hypothetical protein
VLAALVLAGSMVGVLPAGAAAATRGSSAPSHAVPTIPWVASIGSAPYRSQRHAGPVGPTKTLTKDEIEYVSLGPAHYGQYTSDPYPHAHGRRVIWTQGGNGLVKLDAETFRVLATYPFTDHKQWTAKEFFDEYEALRATPLDQQASPLLALGAQTQSAVGAYALLGKDNVFYLPLEREVLAFTDQVQGDPSSPIKLLRRWDVPTEITGKLVGVTATFDGWLMMGTEDGYLVALRRDFGAYDSLQLPHAAEEVPLAHASGRPWNRNSLAVDEKGGVFTVTNNWLDKVVWRHHRLSTNANAGAWSEPYANSTGLGTGSSPVLLGTDRDPDQLVVITDGEPVMNITAYWRDSIPRESAQPTGAPSPRIAAQLRADIGDETATSVQSERSPVISGYTMVLINQNPASAPPGLPPNARVLVSGFLEDVPEYTPHGIQSFGWNPRRNRLVERWSNRNVSAGNSFQLIDERSDSVYAIGVRKGIWTLEGFDLRTGKSRFHWNIGGTKFNSCFSAVYVDDQGRPLYGTIFGLVRLDVRS